jgi:hypothetical protein
LEKNWRRWSRFGQFLPVFVHFPAAAGYKLLSELKCKGRIANAHLTESANQIQKQTFKIANMRRNTASAYCAL